MANVLRIADSARIPSNVDIDNARRAQRVDGWNGYLTSPYASVSWPAAELRRVLDRAGLLLPTFVGPYDGRTLAAMDPARDSEQAHRDLLAIGARERPSLVVLDIEPGAWAASPAEVLRYFGVFRSHLRAEGVDVAPYGSPQTLIGLGQHDDIAHVWCASWLKPYGRKPSPLWPDVITPPGLGNAWHGARGWQLAGGVKVFGKFGARPAVDLSLFPDTFPLLRRLADPPARPAPRPSQPAPAPAPAPDARASVAVTVDGRTYRGSIPRTG